MGVYGKSDSFFLKRLALRISAADPHTNLH
jgi:hypothetical protein